MVLLNVGAWQKLGHGVDFCVFNAALKDGLSFSLSSLLVLLQCVSHALIHMFLC